MPASEVVTIPANPQDYHDRSDSPTTHSASDPLMRRFGALGVDREYAIEESVIERPSYAMKRSGFVHPAVSGDYSGFYETHLSRMFLTYIGPPNEARHSKH